MSWKRPSSMSASSTEIERGSEYCANSSNLPAEAQSSDPENEPSSPRASTAMELARVRALEINARLPRWVRFDDEPEASAYCVQAIGTTLTWSTSLFLTTAMLELANREAGCDHTDTSGHKTLDDCDELIYGVLKPSSLVTLLATISLVGTAIIMPIVGSIVDNSPHRRKLGLYSSISLCMLSFICIFMNQDALLVFALLFICVGFNLSSANVASHAYLVDWKKDHITMSQFQTRFYIARYIAYIVCVLSITIISLTLGLGEIATSRIGQVISTISSMMVIFSWHYLFPERKAKKRLSTNDSILYAGFRELRNTFIIVSRSNPVIISFLAHISFSQAAITSVVAISSTFMSHALEMSAGQIGVAFVLFAVCAIPGSIIGERVSQRSDPFKSLKVSLMGWCVFIPLGSLVLDSPEHFAYAYMFCVIWGTLFGWSLPVGFAAYISILPHDCRPTEMAGLLVFSTSVLSWIPTLMFTLMNESNVSMQIALLSLSLFYFISLVILVYRVGSFEDALIRTRTVESVPPITDEEADIGSKITTDPISTQSEVEQLPSLVIKQETVVANHTEEGTQSSS